MINNGLMDKTGLNAFRQLPLDALKLASKIKEQWRKAMEHHIPDQEVITYVGNNYESIKDGLTLSGNSICNGLENTKGEIMLGCVFIERTGGLILLNTDDKIGKRDTTILEIVLIERLLKEGFRLNIPKFLIMKDLFNPAHIRKLNELGIILEIRIDQHGARQIILTTQPITDHIALQPSS